jgi:hypothetical protein
MNCSLVWKSIDPATDFQGPASEDRKTKCEEWANVHEFILLLCCRIWKEVKSVLCNDSPEGHLLDDINTVDTKDVLSYSFRAVHESRYQPQNCAKTIANKYPQQSHEKHGQQSDAHVERWHSHNSTRSLQRYWRTHIRATFRSPSPWSVLYRSLNLC